MTEIANLIKGINNYDVDGLIKELKEWMQDLSYFYNVLVHVGDNRKSDFDTPQTLQIKAFYFSDTNLKNTYFRKCNLTDCNFSTSKDYVIDPTDNELSGSKFSIPEVLGLLKSFDIKIE